MLREAPLEEFTSLLSSSEPAPGGGSASAAVAAVGAALLSMTCNFTIGKERFKEVEDDMVEAREELEAMRVWFLSSIDRDSEAYGAVVEAMGLPKGDDAEKARRRGAIQAALRGAAEVPLEVARRCARALELAAMVTSEGNPNTVTDSACGARFLHAALLGALYNVRINLTSIKDQAFTDGAAGEVERLGAQGQAALERVSALVEEEL